MGVPDFERVGFTKPASKTLTTVFGVAALGLGILITGYQIGAIRSADRAEVEKLCSEAVSKANLATKQELAEERAARNESVYALKLEQEQRWNAFLVKAWREVR